MALSVLSVIGLDFLACSTTFTAFTVTFSQWHRAYLLEQMGAATRPTFGLLWEVA